MTTAIQILFSNIFSLLLKITIRRKIQASTLDEWRSLSISYSQLAEDLILSKLFHSVSIPDNKWYIDVGAYHPIQYSNTLLLHKLGWNGINIDANPDAILAFRRNRPHDINLHYAISDRPGTVEFQIYRNPTTNRIGSRNSCSLLSQKPLYSIKVHAITLQDIVVKHLPKVGFWGVLSVDCEGHDLAVLRSLDWTRTRPFSLVVEDYDNSLESEIFQFCKSKGYFLYAHFDVARVFVDTNLFHSMKNQH